MTVPVAVDDGWPRDAGYKLREEDREREREREREVVSLVGWRERVCVSQQLQVRSGSEEASLDSATHRLVLISPGRLNPSLRLQHLLLPSRLHCGELCQ